MAKSKTSAMSEHVDAHDAKQVGKHKTDSDEMNDSNPKIVEASARPRATTCRIRT
jgi:hypothetical protein